MGARAGLDRAAVVQAAARLADAEGLDAVTLARLAADLGVRPPSLYSHVAGLEGLRQELAVLGAEQLGDRLTRAAVGRTGADAILAIAAAYRSFAKEHPGLYAASVRAPGPGDERLAAANQRYIDVVRAVMAPFHLDGEDLLDAMRGIRALAHGFVTLELSNGFPRALDVDQTFRHVMEMYVRGFSRGEEHPS